MVARARGLTIAAFFAASYAALVYLLAPISFLQIQVRIANALIGAVPTFGMPAACGIALGVFLGNIFSPLGPIDLLSAAPSFVGLLAIYWLRGRSVLLGLGFYSLIIWVAFMLNLVLGLPYPASFAYVLAGVSAATVGLGYPLHLYLSKSKAFGGWWRDR
ncbi:MAG: QueT transporter family protein [Candidatus Bathyarchaeia archaeon]